MDIGQTTNDNYTYYKGYEPEPDILLSVPYTNFPTLHMWDGFFYDIFRDPPLHGLGWTGFTRDYNQFEGAFENEEQTLIPNPKEYLDDILQYKNNKFFADEVYEVYDIVVSMLRHAVENGVNIVMTYI